MQAAPRIGSGLSAAAELGQGEAAGRADRKGLAHRGGPPVTPSSDRAAPSPQYWRLEKQPKLAHIQAVLLQCEQ